MQQNYSEETLLRPAEVAALANVDRKTVARWAESGKLPSFRTLGGHRRFRLHKVLAALESASAEQ
jgi:excisionase family DNA binding protein